MNIKVKKQPEDKKDKGVIMEYTNEQIKEMSVKDLFKLFFPTFKEIYQSVRYLDIPKEDYFKLVLREISITKSSYSSRKPYKDFIKNRVKLRIVKNEKELLSNTDEVYRVVNNYINLYFKEEVDFNYSKKIIREFIGFLGIYDLFLSPDIIEELLKNPKFNNVVKIIVDKCLPDLSIQKISKINSDYLFSLIIETYALINGIEIKKDDEYEVGNSYIPDELSEFFKGITDEELTYEDCKEYYEKYLNGDMSARDKLIESHLRLVVSIAKTKVSPVVGLMDLIQYGNEGLLVAFKKYDPNRGVKFSTYATYWIRQYIIRALLTNEKTVKYPVSWYEGLKSFINNYNILANELDREPTDDEISERFNISMSTIAKYRQVMQDPKSLNDLASKDNDGDKEFGEFVLHTVEDEVEDKVFKKELSKDIEKAYHLAGLTDREIMILKMRNGFYDGKPMTLQAVADIFHVSRERIQQIERKAARKLRNKPKSRNLLSDYVGIESKPDYEMMVKMSKDNNSNNKKSDDLDVNSSITVCESVSGNKNTNTNKKVKSRVRVKTFWD